MFKRILFSFAFFFLFFNAHATVSVLDPVQESVNSGEAIELGSMMPGETLSITLDRNALQQTWNNAYIDEKLLPPDWTVFPTLLEEKSLVLRVKVPANARLGSQNLPVTVVNESTGLSEEFNAVVFIKDNLIEILMAEPQKRVKANQKARYELTLINRGLAPHEISISSSLPDYWFLGKKIQVKAVDSRDINLWVKARVIGSRDFYFYVNSALFNKRFHSIKAALKTEPTIRGKFSASLNGFPFFMPSLMPYYFIDSFLSLIG